MLRKTIFAAAAVALCFAAATAASTDASAARMFGGFMNHNAGRVLAGHSHRHIGTGGVFHRPGGRTRCHDAECSGGTAPISDSFVLGQCRWHREVLPWWCEGNTQGKTRGLRY